jgi:hypothetical protein
LPNGEFLGATIYGPYGMTWGDFLFQEEPNYYGDIVFEVTENSNIRIASTIDDNVYYAMQMTEDGEFVLAEIGDYLGNENYIGVAVMPASELGLE